MEETKAAFDRGLKRGSFELTFLSAQPDKLREALEIMCEDAVCQTALDTAQRRGIISASKPEQCLPSEPARLERFAGKAPRPCHFSNTFPQDLADSSKENSAIFFQDSPRMALRTHFQHHGSCHHEWRPGVIRHRRYHHCQRGLQVSKGMGRQMVGSFAQRALPNFLSKRLARHVVKV